ncbi:MAG: alpha-E domain-containing protein, partial [Chitinophagaceae bacterium]
MLSRVADSLYWMTRYMERSDGILRMLRVNYASSQDEGQDFSWKPVLRLFTYLEESEVSSMEKNTRATLKFMVTGKENHNSVLNIVIRA